MDTDVWHRFAPFFADVPMPKGVCLTVSHKTHGNREDKNSKVNRAFCRKELPSS